MRRRIQAIAQGKWKSKSRFGEACGILSLYELIRKVD